MLALAVAALLLPSLLHGTAADNHIMELSRIVAAILAVTYVASLRVHAAHPQATLCRGAADHPRLPGHGRPALAIAVLAAATLIVAVESELLVDTIVPVTQSLHLTQAFLGLIVIPIVGNAAEHATAIVAARKGQDRTGVADCAGVEHPGGLAGGSAAGAGRGFRRSGHGSRLSRLPGWRAWSLGRGGGIHHA